MPRTVLIADDHATFRGLARRLLEDAGFVVVGEAHDAESALRGVQELAPEVLLLDVLLPDRSGFDVAAELGGSPGRPSSSSSRAARGPISAPPSSAVAQTPSSPRGSHAGALRAVVTSA